MNPSVSHYGLIEPFELQVSRGQIPGRTTILSEAMGAATNNLVSTVIQLLLVQD